MALIPANHQFGPVEVSGSASLHQGNNYVKNTYYIRTAVFSSPEELQWPNDGTSTSRKRYRDDQDDPQDQCACRSKRCRVGEQRVGEQSDRLLDGHGQPQSSTSTALDSAALHVDSPRGVFLILLEKLRQVLYSPMITRHNFDSTTPDCKGSTPITAGQARQNGALVAITQNDMSKPRNEIAALCVFLLSCLTYRNVSSKDVFKIVTKCQEDRMLPFLTWLLGFGLARYLFLGGASRSLTGLAEDSIILEDAFQQRRRVSMSVCEHFSILKAFLEVHYQGRPGEPLVKAGQFNMTLGSRHGLAIRSSDWQTKGHIQAGSTLVMSIYLRTDDAKCMACRSALTITLMGEFFCDICQTFYRDCDALHYFTRTIKRGVKRKRFPDTEHDTPENTQISDDSLEDDDQLKYNIVGLKNIDLRIVPRQKQRAVLGPHAGPEVTPAFSPGSDTFPVEQPLPGPGRETDYSFSLQQLLSSNDAMNAFLRKAKDFEAASQSATLSEVSTRLSDGDVERIHGMPPRYWRDVDPVGFARENGVMVKDRNVEREGRAMLEGLDMMHVGEMLTGGENDFVLQDVSDVVQPRQSYREADNEGHERDYDKRWIMDQADSIDLADDTNSKQYVVDEAHPYLDMSKWDARVRPSAFVYQPVEDMVRTMEAGDRVLVEEMAGLRNGWYR